MAEGMSFPFPSLPLNEGRTYGQPEVVRISLPQAATGLRLRLPGSSRRRGFQPDLLMPQEALLRRGRSCKCCISTSIAVPCVYCIIAVHASNRCNVCFIILIFAFAGNQCRIRQKGGR